MLVPFYAGKALRRGTTSNPVPTLRVGTCCRDALRLGRA
jgi:hypothetical protein